MTGNSQKKKLGIFRVRCVSCEVKPNAKGKPQVEALLEPIPAVVTPLNAPVQQLFQWYGDISPKSAKYTLASLRALVHPARRDLTRVSELCAAAVWSQTKIIAQRMADDLTKATGNHHHVYTPPPMEAFASVISESFNGEDRIRVEYIYPLDFDPAQPLNGSPLGPRGTPADVAHIDLELAPAAIQSAHSRERMGPDGELEEDASDVVMVQLPLSMVTPLLGKSGTQRYNRHMRRLAQSVARQVKQ